MSNVQIVTEKGRKMALMPFADYKRLLAVAVGREDERDIREAEAVMARVRAGHESLLPSAVVDAILGGVNPVRAWRSHRGLTADALARKAGISRAYLTQIELGKRTGGVDVLGAIAMALGTGVDALIE